jgi:transposase InsO family protein
VRIAEPVNKSPEFVRYAVQRLRTLCPLLGKAKIAAMLCRAGLHLGTTTVGRMLKEPPTSQPAEATAKSGRLVTAKRANHVWDIDLTAVPTGAGYWVPWLPFALPQCWPFCWWLVVIVDHYSRRTMGLFVFPQPPASLVLRRVLGRMITRAGAMPKHLICDKDCIFWCDGFKCWCRRRRIRPRYGAVGQHGSIVLVERFIRTMKDGVR